MKRHNSLKVALIGLTIGIWVTAISQLRADAFAINFDNPTDLTDNFNGSSEASNSNSLAGGLNDTGSISIIHGGGGDTEVWTAKNGLVVNEGNVYSLSLYMYNGTDNSGFGGLGFAIADTNEIATMIAPNNSLGIVFHGGGGWFNNSNSIDGTAVEIPQWNDLGTDVPSDIWLKYTLTLTSLGGSDYDMSILIQDSDSTGTILSTLSSKTLSTDFSTIFTNTDVSSATTIHPYITTVGNRFTNADNYSASVVAAPEASAYSLLIIGGLALIIVVQHRKAAN